MTDTQPKDQIKFIKDLHEEIQKEWSEINNTKEINSAFWDRVSLLRRRNRDFFTAFGNLDRKAKVDHWSKINEITLISTIIE